MAYLKNIGCVQKIHNMNQCTRFSFVFSDGLDKPDFKLAAVVTSGCLLVLSSGKLAQTK